MPIRSLIANCVFSLLLYFINGFLGKLKTSSWIPFEYSSFEFNSIEDNNFSENFIQSIVHPTIYLALVCAILQENKLGNLAADLWLVVPIYWLFRLIHALVWDLLVFTNWRFELISFVISMVLGEGTLFFIVQPLLTQGKTVFIDLGQFRDSFWFAVFTYIVVQIWNCFKSKTNGETLYPFETRTKLILHRYTKFKRKYGSYIESILSPKYTFPNVSYREHFLCLLYAIMIYEDHNRPSIVRFFEYVFKILCWRCSCSLGIMQVQTKMIIGNKKSIELAINKIYEPFSKTETFQKLYQAIMDYNPDDDYYREVISIYEDIRTSLGLREIGTHRVIVRKRSASNRKY